jgi:FMN-dependent NADH-azoreductase
MLRFPGIFPQPVKAILGMIGLRDLTFFSVEGTAFGPDAVAESRARVNRLLQEHFAGRASGRVRPAAGVALPVA